MNLFTHVFALLAAGITGVITAIVAIYVAGLPLGLAAGLLGASIGEATEVVGAISLFVFSLLAGLTLGTEVYIGVVQTGDQCTGPMPGWLRALWAAAGGALVGALPCAAAADWLLLGPAQALHPHALNWAVAFGTATHLVSRGALTGAMTGIAMERFRIWRRPSRDEGVLPSPFARPPARETVIAQIVPTHSQSSRSIGGE